MASKNTTIIEINGVKVEVDLRTAKRVDELKVGDRVKVLIKGYSDSMNVYPGTVIGFEPFQQLPTIIIAYLEKDYSGVQVKFLYFNARTKDTEIIKALDDDSLAIEKAAVLRQLDNEIAKKQTEIEDIQRKKDYFLENFQAYWGQIVKPEAEAEPKVEA